MHPLPGRTRRPRPDFALTNHTRGLVCREFVELEPLARHSKSGMPLTKEFRLFFLDARPF